MSIDYMTVKTIRFLDLFDGRLEKLGISEHINDRTMKDFRCLTDGNNYLWLHAGKNEELALMSSYANLSNHTGGILLAIGNAFDTRIVSEHEPQFWGFETLEEWDLAWEKMAEEDEAKFYEDIMKYVAGELHNIQPDAELMACAEIAKGLINQDPDMAKPERKSELIDAVRKKRLEETYVDPFGSHF
jgi:hypothetical protein